ncbi:SDR family NAD(P)-dependent oxidoreductase [Rhodopseudomonas sp. B29]|uniref:SDR family NAD(P)-dependent oxidoreductase n=1 Tax=Rhodopseudomonas sp. B29 TaxID=95607 RepID=UPI001FCB6DB7|nr:SDR family NAD(P)-dependent oxidoreductase [Rhodopseudomonas sp. B29]
MAVITGASRGIGRGIAKAMASAGAQVVVSSDDAAGCDDTVQEICHAGGQAIAVPANVLVDADLERLVDDVTEVWGRIDILVCNAGITGFFGPMHQAPPDEFEQVIGVNLRSALRLCSLVTPGMAARGDGSVILISSIAGLRGNTNIGSYALSKAGLAQLARNLAVQWGPRNVRANCVSPGLIKTGLEAPIVANHEVFERRMQQTPLRRMGEIAEIAGAAVFLASPAASFITGQNIVVDGGTTITD